MDPIEVGQKYLRRDGEEAEVTSRVVIHGYQNCTYAVTYETPSGTIVTVWGNGVGIGRSDAECDQESDLVQLLPWELPQPEQLDFFED